MSRTLAKKNRKSAVPVECPPVSAPIPVKERQPTVAAPTPVPELRNQGVFPLDLQPSQLVQGFIYGEILGKPRCRRGR